MSSNWRPIVTTTPEGLRSRIASLKARLENADARLIIANNSNDVMLTALEALVHAYPNHNGEIDVMRVMEEEEWVALWADVRLAIATAKRNA